MQALVAPARLIASNAGVEGDVIIEKLTGKPFEMGYNAVRLRLTLVARKSGPACVHPALAASACVVLPGTPCAHPCLPLCMKPC